jgi:hypothetical protein
VAYDDQWYLYPCASPPDFSFAFENGREWHVGADSFGDAGDGVH